MDGWGMGLDRLCLLDLFAVRSLRCWFCLVVGVGLYKVFVFF